MYLLAISGGPDSMFLLNKYKSKKIVVAHVNYHKRKDSDNDENIVRSFCDVNNIPCEVLNVKEKPSGNFQSWARDIRYTFFKEIYDKYNCSKLLTAHHKDDFIETALMQQQSGRTPRFFGIKENNELYGMNIERPLVNIYFKNEIIDYLNKKQISFATDSSNAEPIFERNKIRIELSEKTLKEKQSIYSWFVMSNKILKKKFAKVDYLYKKWKHENYSLDFFRLIKKHRSEILFELINDHFENIKLSKNKLESLTAFIDGNEGNKKFMLDKTFYVEKRDKKLVIKNSH